MTGTQGSIGHTSLPVPSPPPSPLRAPCLPTLSHCCLGGHGVGHCHVERQCTRVPKLLSPCGGCSTGQPLVQPLPDSCCGSTGVNTQCPTTSAPWLPQPDGERCAFKNFKHSLALFSFLLSCNCQSIEKED